MPSKLLSTTRDRRAAYDSIRAAVYELVADVMTEETGVPVMITPVIHGMAAWEAVWKPAHPGGALPGGFDWIRALKQFRSKVERFDAAIWSDGFLCGLAIGKPSRGRRHVSVHLMEGARHTPNPLKGRVLPIVLALADEYAKALGTKYVRLVSPVQGMIPIYQALGFKHVPRTTKCPAYCEREVSL
jgi:hypothetical protein